MLNKRVIVTAPRQYAGKLCGLLVEAGAQALSLPMIRIGRLSQPSAVRVCRLCQLILIDADVGTKIARDRLELTEVLRSAIHNSHDARPRRKRTQL